MPDEEKVPKTVFISYASEDQSFASALSARLQAVGLEVWYDEDSLKLGDSLRRSIEKGVTKSDFAVVICSPDYFRKHWTQLELDSLVQREVSGLRIILPVLHNLSVHDLEKLSPSLASRKAIDSSAGLDAVAAATVAAIRNTPPSPLARPSPVPQPSSIVSYAVLSLICFLLGAATLSIIIWKPEKLAAFGLTDKLFYIVLIPIALSAAGFLFGVLRSYARYSGHPMGGTLELGGPVVVAALVVIGGFALPPAPATFPLTVYVHGEAGPQDLILKDKGKVTIQLGLEPQSKPIRENGLAYFPAVSSQFRGNEVNVLVEADGFEIAGPSRIRITGDSLYLPVRKSAAAFAGYILDTDGNPIEHAAVEVAGVSTETYNAGRFDITVPGKLVTDELVLSVKAEGYQPYSDTVVPRSNEIRIALKRSKK